MSERLNSFVAESEERFRSIFMSSPNGMALVGIDGLYLRVNRALMDLTGYTEAELLSLKSQEITHPDDLEIDEAIYQLNVIAEIRENERKELEKLNNNN